MSKNRDGSPYTDDYSDDFDDDDDADTGNRRYKTRSPLNRTNRSGMFIFYFDFSAKFLVL